MLFSAPRLTRSLVAGVAVSAMLLTACSAGATPSPSVAPSTAPSAAAGGSTLITMSTANGTVLAAGSNQMTVYTFSKDTANSGQSACTGGCLTKWPALTVSAGVTPTAASGVSATLGTITRADDSSTQVTLNGLPLYFFSGDSAPGDTNGYYPNWNLVAPSGSVIPAPSAAASAAGSAAASPAASTAAGGSTVVTMSTSEGTVLAAGSNQMTVYTFSNDTANSGKSACTGGCATTWPPLTVASGSTPTAASGIGGKLGTITRDDGTIQVTYNGLPLYFFKSDSAPGDTKGHYTNWNLVTP